MQGRESNQGDGPDRTAENVVRLPRDWLGPRDELVPMGSRAPTRQEPDDDAARPPAADSFWGEDSGSVQSAMQAPSGEWGDSSERPAQPPPRRPRFRAPRIRMPRPVREYGRRARGRPAVGIAAAAACLLAVLAVIGLTEGGTGTGTHQAASLSKLSAHTSATGVNPTRPKPHTREVTHVRAQTRSHRPTRTRHRPLRTRRIRVTTVHRHPRAQAASHTIHVSSPPAPSTQTETSPTTSSVGSTPPGSSGTSQPSAPPSTVTTPIVPARSPAHSQSSGPSGTGGGAVGSNCNPQCH